MFKLSTDWLTATNQSEDRLGNSVLKSLCFSNPEPWWQNMVLLLSGQHKATDGYWCDTINIDIR